MNLFVEHGWLGWLVIGGIAGAVAKLLMPGNDGGSMLMTIVLGVAGALLSGFLGSMVGWYEPGEGPGFIAAVVGAFVLLLIYRQVRKSRGGA
jgi:uncharacterized membrane protein YeaQ/YmgE (transglycosylase-associated protein family)